jgi:hypothetical protein
MDLVLDLVHLMHRVMHIEHLYVYLVFLDRHLCRYRGVKDATPSLVVKILLVNLQSHSCFKNDILGDSTTPSSTKS